MKKILFSLIFGIEFMSCFSQIKTLIPLDEEVNLPVDSLKGVYVQTSFTETILSFSELSSLFISEIKKTMNSSQYFILDSTASQLEIFCVFPCKSFNLKNIQKQEVINEGLITSSIIVKFYPEEYEIILSDFEWVNRKKIKKNISDLYLSYKKTEDLKEKVKNYGILKSTELSIAESLNNMTVIISEIIKRKAEKENN